MTSLLKLLYQYFSFYFRDWSIVHLMGNRVLPYKVFTPGTLQAAHIGFEGGLHSKDANNKLITINKQSTIFGPFHVDATFHKTTQLAMNQHKKGYGGWGHPADHAHCLELFEGSGAASGGWREKLGIQ